MKEYLILVRTEGDFLATLTPAEQQSHIGKVGSYIGRLKDEGKLSGAQPLEMEGRIITGKNSKLKDGPFNETKEVIAGYFLVKANSLEEAISIAESNPVLENELARLEVRPIKKMDGIN